ncbi:MAG TPA: TetR/AcrR family transcriptional regulator [Candidatus Sulfotelmatobacter sp.]|nr:TetR/AcrR family transcriptional regulator [Candidatus Sulfotelmatobacter sp.]
MSPRPYNMEKRHAVASETRTRILEAARQLLATESETDLSMEAIARRADVSRLTLYYQFNSRTGLLEALYDYLANRGNMRRIPEVFREPDPPAAIDKLVSIFVGFWASDPVALRRLRAMTVLDPEIAKGMRARDARRAHIAGEILKRVATEGKKRFTEQQLTTATTVVSMLTGFATYDALASAGHSQKETIAIIARMARCALN